MTKTTVAVDALAILRNNKNQHEAELLSLKSVYNLNQSIVFSDETPKVVLAAEAAMSEVIRLRIESTQKIVDHLELSIDSLYDIIDREQEAEDGDS